MLTRLAAAIGAFFAWWRGELVGLVPRPLRRLFARGSGMLVIDLSGPEIVVWQLWRRKRRDLGRVARDPSDPGAEAAAVTRILRRVKKRRLETVVRLPRRDALRKSLNLPIAAEENLREVLTFEMDRQTPFKADQVYFNFKVRRRDADAGRIEVDLLTVPRSVVDNAVQRASRWGRPPDIVDVDRDSPDEDWPVNLLPETAIRTNPVAGLLNAALVILAIGLLTATVYVPLERERKAAAEVSAMLSEAKGKAEAALRLRRQVDQQILESGFLVERKRNSVKTVVILEELTRLLPDDTWLHRFHFSAGEVRISGYSPAASRLVGLIEESPRFEAVRFRSPVTRDPREGAERFDISVKIAREPKE